MADGMDPNRNLAKWQRHKDMIREAFILHMGSDVVEAERLRWEGC